MRSRRHEGGCHAIGRFKRVALTLAPAPDDSAVRVVGAVDVEGLDLGENRSCVGALRVAAPGRAEIY